ncbi:MAG: right-handed parallel beta-helix repeat-containing protein [Bacteroidales bacterium]|nr:right-handed parallel beta-helix repeat-containing protein [Bacteroidales bacterium]
MRRTLLLITALALCCGTLQAKDLDLKKCGARADGKTKVTKVLQKAIDDISASGGGRLTVSGGTFLVTPFELKSGVELHIDADAVLLASPDLADYPERTDVRHYDSAAMPRFRNVSLIYADEARDIAITGRGVIDCNGTCFTMPKEGDDWTGWHFVRTVPRKQSLPRVVFFAGCTDVTVTDVTMRNQPAGWSYWIHDCDRVHFDNCKILADVRYPNNDGIHLNCSRDVTVSDCIIVTGDDSIVIRANSRSLNENKACERVVITNCTLRSWSAAVRLAWTNDGVIRNCVLSNLVIHDSSKGVSIDLPEYTARNPQDASNDYGREATLIENISFSNILMDKVFYPVYARIHTNPEVLVSAIRNLSFIDMQCKSLYYPYLQGRKDCPIEDVVFRGCRFMRLTPDLMPDVKRHGAVPKRTTEQFVHVQRLSFEGCTFSYTGDFDFRNDYDWNVADQRPKEQ